MATHRITIPGAYLEDVRSAVTAELEDISKMLDVNQADVVARDTDAAREDRADAFRQVQAHAGLLERLLDADSDATIDLDPETLVGVVQAFTRVVGARLAGGLEYAPIDMRLLAETAERLKWASERYEAALAVWVA